MVTYPASEVALFELRNGLTCYRGVPLERRRITVASDNFDMIALKDAAALLDDAEFVRECEKTDRLPYGFELWPAALMLAEYLYQCGPGQGRLAIELGCGVGLVSIAATRSGWRILATDCDPAPLQFAEFNAAANGVEIHAFQLLDWHNPPTESRFSRVLAADVLYERCDHVPVLHCIDQLLEQEGLAIIADPNRGVADDFESRAEASGFRVEVIPTAASFDRQTPIAGRLFVLRHGRKLPDRDR